MWYQRHMLIIECDIRHQCPTNDETPGKCQDFIWEKGSLTLALLASALDLGHRDTLGVQDGAHCGAVERTQLHSCDVSKKSRVMVIRYHEWWLENPSWVYHPIRGPKVPMVCRKVLEETIWDGMIPKSTPCFCYFPNHCESGFILYIYTYTQIHTHIYR